MVKISKEKINAYTNEYVKGLKKYTTPKIYDADKNIKKRWYVYYYYRNPVTSKLELQTPIYNDVNRIKDTKERTKAIHILRNTIERILEDGFNPYEPDSTEDNKKILYIEDCVNFALDFWKESTRESTFRDYKSRITQFQKWLLSRGHRYLPIDKVNKKIISEYLLEVLQNTSAKNRNNQRAVLSAFFGLLEKNDYTKSNPVETIVKVKASPKRNKTYSQSQENELFNYLEKNDPLLLLFVKFVSYNFLRPIEVARLQVKDINLKENLLTVKAKNKELKTKIIPQILADELQYLKNEKSEYYIFSPTGVAEWNTNEENRRNYWSKRFNKVKQIFGLGTEYGLYSFRHTFITKLYRELRKTKTPFETKSQLMLITGHTTMTALEKYLRDIDAELPEDYSHLF